MYRKSLSIIALLCSIPMAANAASWSLSSRVMTVGGNMTVNGVAQTSANGTVSKTFSTDVPVTLQATTGYTISAVSVNGVAQALPASTSYTMGLVTYPGKTSQSITASYAKQMVSVTSSASTGGGVYPQGTSSLQYGSTANYTFTPSGSNSVVSISGLPAGATLKDATTGATVSLPYPGAVKVSFSVPATTVNLVGGFIGVVANAGSNATILVGSSKTLKGSATIYDGSASASYAWTQVAGPAVTLTNATTATPSFMGSAAGLYQFQVAVTDSLGATSSANTSVTVTTSADQAAKDQCVTCHNSAGVGAGVYANWSASSHAAKVVMCARCHVGADAGSHPGVALSTISCVACHSPYLPAEMTHKAAADTDCQSCHTTGNDYHTVNILTTNEFTMKHVGGKGAPAAGAVNAGDSVSQYLTEGATCTDCHNSTNANLEGFTEGAHGEISNEALNPFTHYDWAARTNDGTRSNSNCDRCHTTAGFMKLLGQSDPRITLTVGKPGNVLMCVTCHNNIETGALRTDATPAGSAAGALSNGYFALFSSSNTAVAPDKTKIQISFPGFKNSSICVPCHAGRSTAAVFVAVIDQAKTVNKNYSTIQTTYYQHGKNIGQNFISQGAYDITGKLAGITANGPSAHAAVKMGDSDTQGPCVGCHHSTTGLSHSLAVDNNSPTCIASACHATAPDVAGAKANFDAGVAALDALIRSKFAPLQTVAGDLAAERVNVRFGRFGKAPGVAATDATAKAAYGAWFNWQILTTYDAAAYVHNPRYARQILNDTLAYVNGNGAAPGPYGYSGAQVSAAIAAGQAAAVAAGAPAVDATAAQAFITAPGCFNCHTDKAGVPAAGGYHFAVKGFACVNCHTEQHETTPPNCTRCHDQSVTDAYNANDAADVKVCSTCHASDSVHLIKATDPTKKCVDCHLNAINHPGGKVADNSGVRAIIPEFQKTSHHIYNGPDALPVDAQCAVCHLEGQAVNGAVVVNTAYHMKDSKVYLRNADTDAPFAWDPMATSPDFTGMDNFCFSCHDANGATSAINGQVKDIQTVIAAANPAGLADTSKINAGNPFGDLLTNKYDQITRAQVVDVDSAFTATNASHHAVKQQKYTTRTTTAAMTAAGQSTLFDGGLFVSDYTPLGAAATVGDDSQLHCGDCHTVGQWKNDNTKYNQAAIGAHGSNNEYLLRNNLGTDALHTGTTLVCFNCHNDYSGITAVGVIAPGQTVANTTATAGGYYAGYNAAGAAPRAAHFGSLHTGLNGDFQNTAGNIGNAIAPTGRLGGNLFNGVSQGGSQGNITGIACINCHNSGLRSALGGIHGGNASYTGTEIAPGTPTGDSSQAPVRFMGGMGNFKYVPPANDLNNVTNPTKPVSSNPGTCYTNAATTDNAGYSSCNHHGTGTSVNRQGGSVGNVARPLSY